MNNLIRGEFYKLIKSKYSIAMIMLSLIFGLFLMCQWDTDAERLQNVHKEIMNGLYAVSYAFQYSIATSILFSILAGEFIAKDFKNSNMSKSLGYGYSRSKVILSKLIVFTIFCLFLEFIYISILVIYVSSNNGFCELLTQNTILYLVRIAIIGVLYILATICIIVMIAIITKSNFYTIILPIFLFISFELAYSNFGSYVSKAFYYMPYIIGTIAVRPFSSEAEIIRSIISSIITLSITIGVSLLYVEREDIK
ncbi:UNVERIFIED_ORG: ABC transporter permease [Clostridium botulinum]|uniref:ABC transporter permease n=1 Tax=Clostridium botulinum TaxID=1491 RepID=UPI0007737CF5|nr:ABC transporter permease [Clostridium botulinum]